MREPDASTALAPAAQAGLTGRGVVVAVIDSGVHPGHGHIAAGRLGPGVMVLPDGGVVEGEDVWLDGLGHGTAVTAAIQEKAPDAVCLPVRVFRGALKTSAAGLIAAIRWSVAARADVINLSLGSLNPAHADAFAAVVDEAAAAGAVVVAAAQANGAPCYPGALDGVVGVDVDWDCPREVYEVRRRDGRALVLASGYPRPIPGVAPSRNLYGVSFAVAQVSGFAARACEGLGDAERGPARVRALHDRLWARSPTS